MRFNLKRKFKLQVSATKVKTFSPGIYTSPGDVSTEVFVKMQKFGKVDVLPEVRTRKVAPENKVVDVTENKSDVAEPTLRSGGTGTRAKRPSKQTPRKPKP